MSLFCHKQRVFSTFGSYSLYTYHYVYSTDLEKKNPRATLSSLGEIPVRYSLETGNRLLRSPLLYLPKTEGRLSEGPAVRLIWKPARRLSKYLYTIISSLICQGWFISLTHIPITL